MSLHPIIDKAEVSVDFPDKAYIGSFGRHSQFDAYADADSVAVRLVRPGEDRREAVMHLHYGLLAEILVELAKSLASRDQLDEQRIAASSARRQSSFPHLWSRARRADSNAHTGGPGPSALRWNSIFDSGQRACVVSVKVIVSIP
jgi:hypothetical protein